MDERKAFQRQPARVILIDFHPPMDTSTCLNIHQALSNTLTLINTITGPNRLPYLSIIVLDNYPECIFPLQPIKNNTVRLTAALLKLKSLSKDIQRQLKHSNPTTTTSSGSNNDTTCLLEGIQESLAQFKRVSQNQRPMGPNISTFLSQVELTLVTCRSPSSLRLFVERVADQMELENLKKISAVCVSDVHWMVGGGALMCDSVKGVGSDDVECGGGVIGSQFTSSPSDLGLSILDLVSIENDVLCLQNIFRGWLHDCNTDKEHLHLILPSPEGGGGSRESLSGGENVEGLVLKCDLQERVLDPSVFGSLGQQFSLQFTVPPVPTNLPSGRTNTGSLLPLLTLRVVAIVKAEGVCEAVVFGVPLILRPTACWRLKWEELETNQQNMHALCQTLTEKGQMLVARSEDTNSFYPHFLILPSTTCTLLIKPVAVGELLLPVELMSEEEQPTKTAMENINMSMSQLETHEVYNPLLVQCGLHEMLASMTKTHNKSSLSRSGPQRNTAERPAAGAYHPYQREPPSLTSNQKRGGRGGNLSKNLGSTRRGHQKGKLGF